MNKSLLDQYPHLKLLLDENKEKHSVNRSKPTNSQPVKEKNPPSSILKPLSVNINQPALSNSSSCNSLIQAIKERKSILGPGIGKRVPISRLPSMPADPSCRKRLNADDLFAESIAADQDQWLSFQIESVAASKQMEELKMWLVTNKPSQVMRSAGIGWISVKMTGRPLKNTQAKEEWDALEGEKTMETVNMIAGKHKVTGGKWMCHVSREMVDRYWSKLAIAMISGGLGPSVYCIKVSPAVEDGGRNEHVICVYTPDYRDTVQVMRVENLMRSAGVVNDLLYKPDIFSTLGIYRANKWGFKASIFGSKVVLLEGRSRISIVGSSISYYNSRKGFENPEELDFDKITAQISASISKPTPPRSMKSVPTKQEHADEALVDMIDKMEREKIEEKNEEANTKTTSASGNGNIVKSVEEKLDKSSENVIEPEVTRGKDNEKDVDSSFSSLSQKFADMGFESIDKLVTKK